MSNLPARSCAPAVPAVPAPCELANWIARLRATADEHAFVLAAFAGTH